MRRLFFLTSLIVFGASAHAQIDPSSALLLNSGRAAPVRESGIDSGRYTVRPRSDSPRREERPTPTRRQTPEVSATATVEVEVTHAPVATPTPAPTPVAIVPSPTPSDLPETTSTSPTRVVIEEPTRATVAQATPQPMDPRRTTMLELSLAPGYLYNDSDSSFTNRNYSVNSPVLSVDANVWFSESFGVHTGFLGTSNAHVSDSLDHQRNVSATEQWFWAGVRTRKFFGVSALAPSLIFGLDYREFQFRVPSDSQLRAKLTTTGPVLSLETELPSSALTSWTLGVTYAPKLRHKEVSNDVDFKSGDSLSASSFGVSLGSRYRFDRSHAMFWKLSQSVEKNVFSGDTSVPDLESGVTQHGVNVTNTTTLFQLGYTWSD
jgi:hypothetical protein